MRYSLKINGIFGDSVGPLKRRDVEKCTFRISCRVALLLYGAAIYIGF